LKRKTHFEGLAPNLDPNILGKKEFQKYKKGLKGPKIPNSNFTPKE